MLKIAVIVGSTRPGRVGEAVAQWVFNAASKRSDAQFELVDIKKFDLPILDEPIPASTSEIYAKEHTQLWSKVVASFDAFVFVTPEYNHGMPASLKNAIDFLYEEWNHKAAAFVSYGGSYGARSVEQLRSVMAAVMIADVGQQVALSIFTDFKNFTEFKPAPLHLGTLSKMLDELILWGEAMKEVRLRRQVAKTA